MKKPSLTPRFLEKHGIGAYFRPQELRAAGFTFRRLRTLLKRGEVERVSRGLYRLADAELDLHETVVRVASACPRGVVCLLTALRMHGIGTQAPREVWLAIDRKDRRPSLPGVPLRIVRFSGARATYAVEERRIRGVAVKLTSPARTVVDCFRYRNKIGLDVALEALEDTLKTKAATVDALLRAAEVCRISSVLRPYLEAATA